MYDIWTVETTIDDKTIDSAFCLTTWTYVPKCVVGSRGNSGL
jgi:hypothetical protein